MVCCRFTHEYDVYVYVCVCGGVLQSEFGNCIATMAIATLLLNSYISHFHAIFLAFSFFGINIRGLLDKWMILILFLRINNSGNIREQYNEGNAII